ncbi:MAG: cyclic pyranopterin monophosphate synthase MoaC [Lentimicrobiaceae bacterium]|jgi:cyclic pyranopterin phosphate synthase|nr:cyclic pyranopterin monophosphate synthase MoaC [Lentimicrobiaceae bacterium]
MHPFTHIDEKGKAQMVNVGHKTPQLRKAKASGEILLQPQTLALISENKIKKGDVLTVAELAGIQAAKQTSHLILLCHPLSVTHVAVKTQLTERGVTITSEVECIGQTGVEMEALTAVSVALLTIYDMCKAVDKTMRLSDIHLVEKTKQTIKWE